jgi:TonB-dependent starch-binding outer membrane protein SusC
MILRWGLVLPLVTVLAQPLAAQARSISGTVTDSSGGAPIVGAVVTVRGGTGSAQTRENGSFVLARAPDGEVTLVVRQIGYRRAEVTVPDGSSGPLEIMLARDPVRLDEVVVTGQFTGIERRNLPNAVATISAEDLENVPTPSLEQQLQGKLAGADIQTNSGAPGGGVQVRLRGVTSINSPAEPLYVVDGVIMSDVAVAPNSDPVTAARGGSNPEPTQENQVNRIADINPNDIERVEVLKGASASAIYGGRASNGVVIITTKRGTGGRASVNLTQRFGFFTLADKFGSRRFANEAEVDAAYGAGSGAAAGCTANSCPYFDHEEELAGQSPLSYETLASVSGGDDNTRYFASGIVKHDGGIIENTGFSREGIRLNLSQRLGSRINVNVNTNVLHTNARRGLTNNDNTNTSYYVALAFTPSFVDLSRNPDGTFKPNTFTTSNPLQTAALSDISEDVWRFVSGVNLDWTMLQGQRSSLKFTAAGGLDFFNQENKLFFPPELQFESNDGLLGTSLLSKSDNINLNLQGGLIHTLIGGGFTATTSGGVQYARRDLDIDRTVGRNLVGGQSNVDAATSIAKDQQRELIKDLGYFIQEEVLLADERLLLTAGVRADQSSLNADAEELFWYPKGAASYRFPGLLGAESEFKLRGAYGESGNQPRYGQKFTPISSTSSIGGLPGLVISTGNETGADDLRPERLREFEVGFDGSLGGGRTTFELTGYQKNVKDLLLRRDLPESSGFQREIFNGGKLRTRGLEAAVGLTPVERRGFSWFVRTTFSMSRSTITELDAPPFQQGGFGAVLGTWQFEEDTSATRIVGNDTLPDGSVVVRRIGDSNPSFRLGLSNSITFGRFGLSFLLDWQKGSDIINLTKLLYDLGQVSPDYADPLPAPVQDGTNTYSTVGELRLAGFGRTTANFLESASFLKMREITLSYSVPGSVMRGLFGSARSARISLSARNLFSIDDYSGLDPEVSNFGNQAIFRNIDVAPYPPSRSFWLSIDLGL